jgi:hypothetical protein
LLIALCSLLDFHIFDPDQALDVGKRPALMVSLYFFKPYMAGGACSILFADF